VEEGTEIGDLVSIAEREVEEEEEEKEDKEEKGEAGADGKREVDLEIDAEVEAEGEGIGWKGLGERKRECLMRDGKGRSEPDSLIMLLTRLRALTPVSLVAGRVLPSSNSRVKSDLGGWVMSRLRKSVFCCLVTDMMVVGLWRLVGCVLWRRR
jgi:hypothetical protein